ncbi:hypothetical protein GGR50DRAFT_217326 [Xylaria sp. CBS 124048]|nr:hypothetical protein GGR50DRAFT_217326 [Xylaria sp. CBS 124048]
MTSAMCMRRPKMGSSPDLPFGYYVSEESFLSPPPPPRGDPILDLNDSSLLGNFFHGMESNEFNFSYGEGLNFSDQWAGQVAPNLLGHATSFGPQPPLDQAEDAVTGLPLTNWQDMYLFGQPPLPVRLPPHQPPPQPRPPPQQHQRPQQLQPAAQPPHQHFSQPFQDQRNVPMSIDQNAHEDIAVVLTNLHHSNQHNHYPARTNSLNGFHPPPTTQPLRNHTNSLSYPTPTTNHNDPTRVSRSNESDTLFTDMMFGGHEPTAHHRAEPQPLQWGSDNLFARNQGYVPPAHESSEALEKKRVATIKEAFRINGSNPNTQPPSPTGREPATHTFHEHQNGHAREETGIITPPRKRHKSKARIDVEEDVDNAGRLPLKTTARKRKSKGDYNGASEIASITQEASGKRRKSTPNQSKPPRENLTDAQKRENHIKSEQKRRGAIKEGFEDLTFIVPNLQNGGYSKSTMLLLAGEWLETLINENEKLKKA